ncbi:MAG: hypothetical protein V5A64_02800 [Candidatus Thermoplasmatota archaeon]
MVKIKNRKEILNDIIKDGKKHPKGWKAVFGKDHRHLSNDYYILNPKTGIYLLKEYQKNPFQRKGIGGKIAKKVDEHVENEISKYSGDFGIVQGDFQKVLKNLKKGVKPDKILKEAVKGKKDLGLRMPIKGEASSSEETYTDVKTNMPDKQKKIDSKFEEIAKEDGLYKSYG